MMRPLRSHSPQGELTALKQRPPKRLRPEAHLFESVAHRNRARLLACFVKLGRRFGDRLLFARRGIEPMQITHRKS